MQGPMLKVAPPQCLIIKIFIYISCCRKYIRMMNGLRPFAELCMDVCYAGQSSHSRRFSPIAALARSYFCKIKSVTTSPSDHPRIGRKGGVFGD